MGWKFNNETPIYLQIMDALKAQIAQGQLKPGDKVPAVRELAVMAGVNPNTMQKALSELEREGVLCSQRTNGRYVSENINNEKDVRKELAGRYVKDYVTGMSALGCSKMEMKNFLEEYLEEKNE